MHFGTREQMEKCERMSKQSVQYTVRVPHNLSNKIREEMGEEVTATEVICNALELYFYAQGMMQNE